MATEGYVLHAYGPEKYLHHVVASVVTLRRHDTRRPVALYCTPEHREVLARHGLDTLFAHIEDLPEAHRSIVGFKHHVDRFMAFDRSLFVDADMVWCRDPDPLWRQLSGFDFTATGLIRADFYFGGPKGLGVVVDFLLNRRDRTLRRFGLTHLPRVQAGMIYSQDAALAERVCATARDFLARRAETHFRSRLNEGRSEESCEWSMAMAMSRLHLPIFFWRQGYNSPQLDFVEDFVDYDPDFERVVCRYYSDPFVHSLRFMPNRAVRDLLLALWTRIPGRGDYLEVTPFALHFGWIRQKRPFYAFAERTWARLISGEAAVAHQAEGAARV